MNHSTPVGVHPEVALNDALLVRGLKEHGIYTRVVDGIRIHAITCGWIKYRNAHVHSILGPYFVLLDPTWNDWMPIYSWVIEHPEGTIVIDTGETARSSRPEHIKGGGMNAWLNQHLARINVNETSDLRAQLDLLGIHPDTVRWVILTHLHLDHAGGLGYFPKAEILVAHKEFVRPYAFVEGIYPSWFDPHLIGHFDDMGGPFESGHVLTQAGDVIIVPTPGHTPYHQSVILKTSEADFFFAGDASFTYSQIVSGFVPGINADRQVARQTLEKIKVYCRERSTICLPSHDLKSTQRFFMQVTD